jgi:2-hydroxychromene-2-carboxylate isomerase
VTPSRAPPQPVFYYDLGHAGCYVVAERIMSALAVVPEWEPVLGSALGALEDDPDREALTRQVDELGLQPLRWPTEWPPDTELAMRAATYAKRVGRAVAFSLAAFRQAFAGGRDLGEEGTVLIAGAACEMHPTAILKGVGLRSVRTALESAGERARAAGVQALPAIQVGNELFAGEQCIERAGAALETRA